MKRFCDLRKRLAHFFGTIQYDGKSCWHFRRDRLQRLPDDASFALGISSNESGEFSSRNIEPEDRVVGR